MSFNVDFDCTTSYLARQILHRVVDIDRANYARVILGKRINKLKITKEVWDNYNKQESIIKRKILKKKIEMFYLRAGINKINAKYERRKIEEKYWKNKEDELNEKEKEKRIVPKGTPIQFEKPSMEEIKLEDVQI